MRCLTHPPTTTTHHKANNHALDYSEQGLLDTLDHLKAGGIQLTGAGRNVEEARRPVILSHHGVKIGIIGFTDHPAEFAATNNRPGVAYADLVRPVGCWGGMPSTYLLAHRLVTHSHKRRRAAEAACRSGSARKFGGSRTRTTATW